MQKAHGISIPVPIPMLVMRSIVFRPWETLCFKIMAKSGPGLITAKRWIVATVKNWIYKSFIILVKSY